jgi:ABC-2 type transport system permease protein
VNASYATQPTLAHLTTFRRQALLSYKGQFLWLNWPAYVSNVLLRPGLMVAMFSLAGRFARGTDAAEAYVIGLTAYAVPSIIFGGVLQSFYYERAWGTLSFVFAARGGRLGSFFSRGLLHMPNALLAVAAALIFAAIFLDAEYPAANWAAVCAAYLLMTLASTACALCLANLCIVLREWMTLYGLLLSVFLVCCGVIIPLDELPLGLGLISAGLPTTHALAALRDAFAGASFGAVAGDLVLEAIVGLAYAITGYLVFQIVEAYARRSGAYDAI